MRQEEIFERTRAILMDCLGLEQDVVTHDAAFTDDLGCDSLGLSEIIMKLENEFGISIDI